MKDKYQVESIESYQTYDWILNKHYAKRIPSISFSFGLFENGILIGVCTFGCPASRSLCVGVCGEDKASQVIELNRLCLNDHNEKNITSYFLSKSLKKLPGGMIIVSYADTAQNHHGYIYQATNWIYTGATKERTDIGTEENKHSRHYVKGSDYSKNRKTRSSKHRYIYFTGTKKQIKKLKSKLKYKSEPYPKGQNINYDTSYNPEVQLKLI